MQTCNNYAHYATAEMRINSTDFIRILLATLFASSPLPEARFANSHLSVVDVLHVRISLME